MLRDQALDSIYIVQLNDQIRIRRLNRNRIYAMGLNAQ